MKTTSKFFGIFFLLGCSKQEKKIISEEDKLGYVIGIDIGKRLKKQPIGMDFESLLLGVQNAYLDQPYLLSKDSIRTLSLKFQQLSDEYEVKMQQRRELALRFLDSNKNEKGIVSHPSGLQYQILAKGNGFSAPKLTSQVKCHLKGWLLDGKVIEDSFSENKPRIFKVGDAIEGVKIVLQFMSPGTKCKVWAYPPLAYGRDRAGFIPEYSLLIYEIELIEIVQP